jgi:hypothetical protein
VLTTASSAVAMSLLLQPFFVKTLLEFNFALDRSWYLVPMAFGLCLHGDFCHKDSKTQRKNFISDSEFSSINIKKFQSAVLLLRLFEGKIDFEGAMKRCEFKLV